MRVLIIEDEKLLQQELIIQLEAHTDIVVIKCIQTVKESILWLKEYAHTIDLIFMDIELSDGISFEIFDSIHLTTPIIFLTAYSEYALKAFKVNSVDYLLKPVDADALEFALNKFKEQKKKTTEIDPHIFRQMFAKPHESTLHRLLIQIGDHYRYLMVSEIAYFLAEDKYTTVVTFENKRYIIDKSLNQLESTLATEKFYRPTRNIIVNIEAVHKASKYFNGRLLLSLKPSSDTEIIISRAKVKSFLEWMGTAE